MTTKIVTLFSALSLFAADPKLLPGEREGAATIIHKADVVRVGSTNSPARGGLWPLYSSPEARLNYFAVTSPTSLHFHPDADHRLYVLEGKVVVTCGAKTTTNTVGDFILIPRGVRHSYNVVGPGERALLLTFDAPPYDPSRTVSITSPNASTRGPAGPPETGPNARGRPR